MLFIETLDRKTRDNPLKTNNVILAFVLLKLLLPIVKVKYWLSRMFDFGFKHRTIFTFFFLVVNNDKATVL